VIREHEFDFRRCGLLFRRVDPGGGGKLRRQWGDAPPAVSASVLDRTRIKQRSVANSLEEAGERLFAFTRLPPTQWRSVRTTNAIERLHEEFKRRIKAQTVLPSADTAAMLFWALPASGQINMRKVDGRQTLATQPIDQPIDLAA
jgi:transposase-like protein